MEQARYIFGEIRNIPDNVDETRTIEFEISNEVKDRHGSKLKKDRWILEHYSRNPIVGYQHNVYGGDMCNAPNPDDVIGRSKVYFEGNSMIGAVTFEPPELNPLAEKIFQKCKFGTLNAASVGFIGRGSHYGEGEERQGGKQQTEYFDSQELLEWSIVNIPSNPTAGRREFNVQNLRALNYISKATGLSQEDIKKMTVDGVMRLLSGESLEKDTKENEAEVVKNDEMKIRIQQQQMKNKLKFITGGLNNE